MRYNWTTTEGGTYYAPPLSALSPLDSKTRTGLLLVGTVSLLSALMTSYVLVFMGCRMVTWRRYYAKAPQTNQDMVLLFNLMLSALILSMSFVIGFYWYTIDAILTPHAACNFQGAALNFGSVSNEAFTFFMAIEIMWVVRYRKRIRSAVFYSAVAFCWILPAVLTLIGPLTMPHYFRRIGFWCWACPNYKLHRFALQYFWLIALVAGTSIVYVLTFIHVRRQLRRSRLARNTLQPAVRVKVNRAARYMLVFPAANLFCMLPIIAVRSSAMARDREYSETVYMVVGSIVALTGIFDTILYAAFRSTLERDSMQFGSGHSRQGSKQSISLTSRDTVACHYLDSPRCSRPRSAGKNSLDDSTDAKIEQELRELDAIAPTNASPLDEGRPQPLPPVQISTAGEASSSASPTTKKSSSFWNAFTLIEEDGGPEFRKQPLQGILKEVEITCVSQPISELPDYQPGYYDCQINDRPVGRPMSGLGPAVTGHEPDADEIPLNHVTTTCEATHPLGERPSRADRPLHARAYRYYS